ITSMPASRSARAMILAPRSCPSRPGFATTTRILRLPACVPAAEVSAVLSTAPRLLYDDLLTHLHGVHEAVNGPRALLPEPVLEVARPRLALRPPAAVVLGHRMPVLGAPLPVHDRSLLDRDLAPVEEVVGEVGDLDGRFRRGARDRHLNGGNDEQSDQRSRKPVSPCRSQRPIGAIRRSRPPTRARARSRAVHP